MEEIDFKKAKSKFGIRNKLSAAFILVELLGRENYKLSFFQ